jgi:peroxiredoxin (alkyl hydroperoxide reductase subunit C)
MIGKKGGCMSEPVDKCVKPSKGVILPQAAPEVEPTSPAKEVSKMLAKVGKEAPDFELPAFCEGGFKNVRLSDYKGKWIIICFYPGDFTFV